METIQVGLVPCLEAIDILAAFFLMLDRMGVGGLLQKVEKGMHYCVIYILLIAIFLATDLILN